jgi:hypothetical protein
MAPALPVFTLTHLPPTGFQINGLADVDDAAAIEAAQSNAAMNVTVRRLIWSLP